MATLVLGGAELGDESQPSPPSEDVLKIALEVLSEFNAPIADSTPAHPVGHRLETHHPEVDSDHTNVPGSSRRPGTFGSKVETNDMEYDSER
jgi:hypothetical protein